MCRKDLIHCITDSIMFLFTAFKERRWKMFPSIRTHSSHLTNNVKLLTVKSKALHSGWFSSGHTKYHCYYLTSCPQVTTTMGSGLAKDKALFPSLLLSPQTLSKESTEMQPERNLKMVSEWVQYTCELMVSEEMDSITLAALNYTHTHIYIRYKHAYYIELSIFSILIQVVPLHACYMFRLPYRHIHTHTCIYTKIHAM